MGQLPLTKWEDFFYCDGECRSGLRWKVNRYRGPDQSQLFIAAGEMAGGNDVHDGYWKVSVDYDRERAHRVVFYLHHGYMPEFVDHFDGNKSNNAIGNLRDTSRAVNARNTKMSSRNTSGVTGVNLEEISSNGKVYLYWRVTVQAITGGSVKKNFSVTKLGNEEAFRQACAYRAAMIEELNKQGAGYTERHGEAT